MDFRATARPRPGGKAGERAGLLDYRVRGPKYFARCTVGDGCRTGPSPTLARCRGERCMSRLSLFNSPLLLGFDHFERALDRVSKVSADGYPPYNVEQLGENALRITLAVAGFTDERPQHHDRGQPARGPRQANRRHAARLLAPRHRGAPVPAVFCASRRHRSQRRLLDNGLLHIDLVRPEVESRVRNVEIKTGSTTGERAPVGSGS